MLYHQTKRICSFFFGVDDSAYFSSCLLSFRDKNYCFRLTSLTNQIVHLTNVRRRPLVRRSRDHRR